MKNQIVAFGEFTSVITSMDGKEKEVKYCQLVIGTSHGYKVLKLSREFFEEMVTASNVNDYVDFSTLVYDEFGRVAGIKK